MTGYLPGDKIGGVITKALKATLDILLPPVCYVCRNACSGKYGLCDPCLGKIRYVRPSASPVEKGWSCCYYESTVRECIHLFKYSRYVGLADVFRDIMVNFIKKNEIAKDADLIVPVPVHPAKKRERSYNHAEILARSLSKALAIPVDLKNLKKIKWTRSQSELDREERLRNVKDTFLAVDRGAFNRRRVLIVDDVYTTGATVNECAKALLDAGARSVRSLTLARGL